MSEEIKYFMNIGFIYDQLDRKLHSGLKKGAIKLPEGIIANGDLILVGENEAYLHCFISGSWDYYGIWKSDDENHLYQHILRLNT